MAERTNTFLDDLQAARRGVVEERRRLAAAMADKSGSDLMDFVDAIASVQLAVDAIDRAIGDEEQRRA